MNRLISLMLAMMALVTPSFASTSISGDSLKPITLETEAKNNGDGSDRHRAPLRIGIEAYYNTVEQSINIFYVGEATGEVFLYLDGSIIGYDSDINTSFPVSTPGLYKIEILGENWVAEGYIQL